MKKTLSVVIIFTLIFSMFAITPVSADTKDTHKYVWKVEYDKVLVEGKGYREYKRLFVNNTSTNYIEYTGKYKKADPVPTVVKGPRVTTGIGKTLTFKKGSDVCGWGITINGKTFTNGVYIKNSPMEGEVTDGVIWPTAGELKGLILITNEMIGNVTPTPIPIITPTPTPTPIVTPTPVKGIRTVTGINNTLTFRAGEDVSGAIIKFDNGLTYNNSVVYAAPFAGTVTTGVVWPNNDDIKNLKIVNPKYDKPDNMSRRDANKYSTVYFVKGETVSAETIIVNGKTFRDATILNCPYEGYLTNGTVWPTMTEINKFRIIDPTSSTSYNQRVITGQNQSAIFRKGDTVWGEKIIMGNEIYYDKVIVNATSDGTVVSGIIWPYEYEITNKTKVIFP